MFNCMDVSLQNELAAVWFLHKIKMAQYFNNFLFCQELKLFSSSPISLGRFTVCIAPLFCVLVTRQTDKLCFSGGDYSLTLQVTSQVFMSESSNHSLKNTDSFRNSTIGCLHEWVINSFTQSICSKSLVHLRMKQVTEWAIESLPSIIDSFKNCYCSCCMESFLFFWVEQK